MNNPIQKKILVIRFSSLGDVLLTTPVLRALKVLYPDSKIDFIVRKEFADALRNNPNINNLYEFSRSENEKSFRQNLINENYDLVIDLQNNLRSKKISSLICKKKYSFKKPTLKKILLVKLKINLLGNLKSIPQMYAESLPDLILDDYGLDLFLPENVESKIKKEQKKIIGFCPGAKHFTKRWPQSYFVELGNKLFSGGYQVVIFGGKDDTNICNTIARNVTGAINLCSTNNLYQTAVNMKQCDLIVCNDSGLMHVASALGIPVITIFGSSVKEFGFTPYKNKSIILENNNLNCRPCSHIGRKSCPKHHFKCMMDLSPSMVFNNLKNLL